MQAPAPTTLTVAAFRSLHRGGGIYSEAVSQRLGAGIAWLGYRLRLSPSALTIIGVVLGVGASVALTVLAPATASDPATAAALGLAAGAVWQLAYAFDCADGQLARATGRASAAGARLDILCDVATQVALVTALSAVAAAQSAHAPPWVYAAFAGTWMVNLVTSVLAGGPGSASLLTSQRAAVRVVKLARDYGAVIALCALVVAFAPGWTVALIIALAVINGSFLVASIGQAALRSAFPPDTARP